MRRLSSLGMRRCKRYSSYQAAVVDGLVERVKCLVSDFPACFFALSNCRPQTNSGSVKPCLGAISSSRSKEGDCLPLTQRENVDKGTSERLANNVRAVSEKISAAFLLNLGSSNIFDKIRLTTKASVAHNKEEAQELPQEWESSPVYSR